ncbi:MAG: DUF6273 domain-containing protein [Candidatus Cloacimonetes bacterium]|nr:DUF6273 domain-containing protein [Candidatus Cloacimonadota bacterium]
MLKKKQITKGAFLKVKNLLWILLIIMSIIMISCSDKKTDPPSSATITLSITSSFEESVNGARVELENHIGGDPFLLTVSKNPVVFTDIPYGNYSVKITHRGHDFFVRETLSVQSETVSLEVELTHSGLEIGETVLFHGSFWIVLDIQPSRALIISEEAIDRRAFQHSSDIHGWKNSNIREYLNGTYYNSLDTFNQSRIHEITNTNEANQWYGTAGDEDTIDKIFLLSLAEVVSYFGDSGQLENRPGDENHITDQYNPKRVAKIWGSEDCFWWLRSPGENEGRVVYVGSAGSIYVHGYYQSHNLYGVRPALWLRI